MLGKSLICMKSRIRAFLMLALVLMMVSISIKPVKVYANSYSVPSADFVIEIDRDGKVKVTEYWKVSFEDGQFTRFYKDIYTDLPKEEEMTLDLDSFEVMIDDVQCEYTDDTKGRPDYHYNITSTGKGQQVSCYCKSEDVTRNYVISYTLENSIKYVDNSYYLFTYRLIGKNF